MVSLAIMYLKPGLELFEFGTVVEYGGLQYGVLVQHLIHVEVSNRQLKMNA